jgi:drug/metabolite transporter (DMT)-like permease
MPRFDIYKTLSQTGGTLKQLSVLNPLTIHKKGSRAKAIFCLVLVCFFWGTTWLASHDGVQHMPALQLAGIRQLIGGSCYVLFFLYKGVKWPKLKEWQTIVVLSALNFFLSNGLATWGVQYISAGLGAIIGAIFPLWLVVIGLFISKSNVSAKAVIGLLLGFGGVCIIFSEHLRDFFNADFRFGIILSLLATWTWAFGTLYTKRHAASFNPYFSLGLQMFISGIALYTVAKATNRSVPINAIPIRSWISIGYLVLFGSIISFIAYLYALQRLSTEQTSIYAYINPIVAVLSGWIVFGEKLTVFIALGGLVALFGVYLVNKAYKISTIEQPESEGV